MFRRILTTTRPFALPTPALRASRPFTQATPTLARKDTQHKDSLKPEPNEYSKSGSDDAAAAVENAAFDPKQTSPEEEMSTADKESGSEVRCSCTPFWNPSFFLFLDFSFWSFMRACTS